jgi:dihydrolipoamide dehydrogenase
VPVDETIIVTSTGALTLPAIPKSMVVIGAGVIGLEMGSVYARLGTKVTVVEYLDAITPGLDGETAKSFEKILKKQGLTFILGAAVQSVTKTETATGTSATITYKRRKDDAEATIDADVVLVATGRKPFTTGLGLESLGVEMLPRGQIKTTHFVTNIPGLYAIGDATTGPMLAHKAEDEGMALAEILAGKSGHVNYDLIPGVIYTTPEVASIGATEEQLHAALPHEWRSNIELVHAERQVFEGDKLISAPTGTRKFIQDFLAWAQSDNRSNLLDLVSQAKKLVNS